MDSRRLRQFLAVYETGSIASAAEVLFLTQPALSKSMKALEHELAVDLFERTPSGVKPTIFAEALARHARRVVSELQAAESQIAHLKGETGGKVHIGVGPSIASKLIPDFLCHCAGMGNGLALQVSEGSVGELIPALRKEELDFVLSVYPESGDPELTAQPLLSDCATIVGRRGHPIESSGGSIAQLLKFPWILPPPHHSWRAALDSAFAARGLPAPQPMVITNSPPIILSVLRRSDMLSFLPGFILNGRRNEFFTGMSDLISADLKISIIRAARKRPTPAALHVIDLLNEFVKNTISDIRPSG